MRVDNIDAIQWTVNCEMYAQILRADIPAAEFCNRPEDLARYRSRFEDVDHLKDHSWERSLAGEEEHGRRDRSGLT